MAKSLQDWEDHFGDFSFCESDLGATQTDLDLFEKQSNKSPDSEKYPNFARWYKTVKARHTPIIKAIPTTFSETPSKMTENALTPDQKYELITRNLQETLGGDDIKKVLAERDVKLYWGTATTGRPHIAYFVAMSKIADFLNAGCEVTILFADLHAYLDNMKAPWSLLEKRAKYYEAIIKSMLKSIGVPLDKLKFVQGTSYQLSREYSLDVYKLSSLVTEHDAKKAGAEVVKQVSSPCLSGMLYPLLQGLDEHYLGVDVQFGGADQRKIFTFARENMPRIGYKKCAHLMNPMVPGLTGSKMSSSDAASKLDLLDSAKDVKTKISKAFCEPGNVESNGPLSFTEHVLLPIFKEFTVERKEEYGGNKAYTNIKDIQDDFLSEALHPGDLKKGVIEHVNKLLEPIRQEFSSKELQELTWEAYPETKPKVKAPPKKKGNQQAAQPITPGRLDMRVGLITSVEKHPDSEKLFIEKVDFGIEIGERQILSGLNGLVPMDHLEGTKRVFLVNLKPAKMGGIESQGMLMCTRGSDGSVEPLSVPESAENGDRICVTGFESEKADERLNPKKKIWETLAPEFKVDENGEAQFKGTPIVVEGKGTVTSATIRDGQIS
jgi:tyrosyl-tRNA synthetase